MTRIETHNIHDGICSFIPGRLVWSFSKSCFSNTCLSVVRLTHIFCFITFSSSPGRNMSIKLMFQSHFEMLYFQTHWKTHFHLSLAFEGQELMAWREYFLPIFDNTNASWYKQGLLLRLICAGSGLLVVLYYDVVLCIVVWCKYSDVFLSFVLFW